MSRTVPQVAEQLLPPLREPKLKNSEREAMSRRVTLRDRVPTEVFDRDSRLLTRSFEAHVQLGALVAGKARLPPGHDQAVRRVPDAHLADDELGPVLVGFEQATIRTGLEREHTCPSASEFEQHVGPPPLADLLREGGERALRRRVYPDRQEHARARGHGFLSR